MHNENSTIYALSSGRGASAIAVVRVSGPRAHAALAALGVTAIKPREAKLARLRDPQTGAIIDEALVLWFPGPRSETGEDVVELQVHGGRAVIAATLAALGKIEGLRPAEAGEFTRRAFENGKLDLTAVEGLADLVMAETEGQRAQALRQMQGALGRQAEDWRTRLIEALALVEAGIDFSDEADVPGELVEPALVIARELEKEIAAALADGGRGERLREGLVVAIAGPPNAGKSTLLNRIAQREAAIVSPYAGTTRDIIEVHLDLGGWPVTLLDTAGIRETDNPVEREGVHRARTRAAAADLVLWVEDARATASVADAAGMAQIERRHDKVAKEDHATSAEDRMRAAHIKERAAHIQKNDAANKSAAAELGHNIAAAAFGHNIHDIHAVAKEALPTTWQATGKPSRKAPVMWLVVNKIDLINGGDNVATPQDIQASLVTPSPFETNPVLGHTGSKNTSPAYASIDAHASPERDELKYQSYDERQRFNESEFNSIGPAADNASGLTEVFPAETSPTETKVSPVKNEFQPDFAAKFEISAASGRGISQLLSALTNVAAQFLEGAEPALITRARHRHILEEVLAALRRAVAEPVAQHEDLLAEELRLAATAIGRLTGRVDVEDILDVIFRDFCIGK